MKKLSWAILGIGLLLQLGCATDQAATLRKQKNITIGLTGVSFRPTENIGIGVGGALGGKVKNKVTIDEDKATEEKVDYTYGATGFTPFLQFFPWKSSAFFIGVGGESMKTRYTFEQDTLSSTAADPQKTKIEFTEDNLFVGMPVGWAWIWGSGFSFQLEFGPQHRVRHKRTFTKDGKGLVDEDRRDTIADKMSKSNSGEIVYLGLGGATIVGWSF